MATITFPAEQGATRPVTVRPSQRLRLLASGSTGWWQRNLTTGSAWASIGSAVSELVWDTPSSVGNRLTFDRLQLFASDTSPDPGETGGLYLNLCEGPPAVLWASALLRNEAMEEPPLRPWQGEDDDPPLGLPLVMPAANRDRMGTVLLETVAEPGGPVDLVALSRPGLFVDSAGRLGARTAFTNDVRGLGPYPAIAAWYQQGCYFQHDFGKSRNLALTRVLYEDAQGHVAIVRGDGRRNTYVLDGGSYYPAVALRNTLAKDGSDFLETTPSGRVYRYTSAGKLDRVQDRAGTAAYYAYDVNGRLQRIQGITGAGALGLVPYFGYDGSGRLVRLVLEDGGDPANNRVSYLAYDGDSNLTRITGPEDCVTYFAYSGAGGARLASLGELGGQWSFTYDGSGRVAAIVDAQTPGRATYFTWDGAAPLVTIQDRAGKATYFAWNAFGGPDTVWNPATPADYYTWDEAEGHLLAARNRIFQAWTWQYDPRSNRLSSTDPLGARSYFAWDTQNLLRFYADPLGRFTYMEYDGARNRTRWIDPLGGTCYYEYEPTGLLRWKKDRRGQFSYLAWDARANQTAAVDALDQPTYFQHSPANELTLREDPLGRVTRWERDLRGRLTKRVDPTGAATYFTWNERSLLTQEQDALFRTREHSYDPDRNLTLTRNPLGYPTYLTYDPEDRLASRTDPLFRQTTWSYDALGRLQSRTDALNGVTYLAYTAAHQVERQLDPRLNATYFQYDPAGRPSLRKDALQHETYFGWNAAGEGVLVRDARSNPTYLQYDPRGWLRRVETAVGAVSYLTFDPEGNRLRQVDPLGFTSYFTFDPLGRPTHRQDAAGGVTYVGYDRASQAVLRVDELGYPSYTAYDLAGRRQTRIARGGLVTYQAYDLVGRPTHVNLDQGWGWQPWGSSPYGGERATTYLQHDQLDRRIKAIDPYGGETYLAWDAVGNLERRVDERGFATYLTHDALDRLTHVKDGVHFASTYMGYDPVGNLLVRTDPQGYTDSMAYDRLNRLEFRLDRAGLLAYHSYDQVGNRVESQLLLGPGGQRRSSYFEFDRVDRLIRQRAPDTGETYLEFDLAGNTVRVVDPAGRATYLGWDRLHRPWYRSNALGEFSYLEYDLRSSVLKAIDGEGRAAYYTWDSGRRLRTQSNALGERTYLGFDARGHTTTLEGPLTPPFTRFLYDLLGRRWRQRDEGLFPTQQVSTYMGYDATGNLVLAVDRSGRGAYYVYDGMGRVARVGDALGGSTYFGWDSRGSQVLRLDAQGRATYAAYDAAARLEREWFANPVGGEATDPPCYYQYDQVSALVVADDSLAGLGASTLQYDVMSRVVQKTTAAGAVYSAYDLSGLRTSLVDPGLASNAYVFDAAGRLVTQELDGARAVYFAWDKAGLLVRRLLPGGEGGLPHRVMAYLTYDAAGRILHLENRGSAWSNLISYFHYERNGRGQVSHVRREGGKDSYYLYDDPRGLGRLSFERHQTGSTIDFAANYSYDEAGNRTFVSKSFPLPSQLNFHTFDNRSLLQVDWIFGGGAATYYDYDPSQRLRTRLTNAGGTAASHYFTYDQRDRLVRLDVKGSPAITTFERGYTSLGEPVVMRDDPALSPAYFSYDGRRVLSRGAAGGGSVTFRWRHNQGPDGLPCMLSWLEYEVTGTRQYPSGGGEGNATELNEGGGSDYSYYAYNKDGQTRAFQQNPALPQNLNLGWRPDLGAYRFPTSGEFWSLGGNAYYTGSDVLLSGPSTNFAADATDNVRLGALTPPLTWGANVSWQSWYMGWGGVGQWPLGPIGGPAGPVLGLLGFDARTALRLFEQEYGAGGRDLLSRAEAAQIRLALDDETFDSRGDEDFEVQVDHKGNVTVRIDAWSNSTAARAIHEGLEAALRLKRGETVPGVELVKVFETSDAPIAGTWKAPEPFSIGEFLLTGLKFLGEIPLDVFLLPDIELARVGVNFRAKYPDPVKLDELVNALIAKQEAEFNRRWGDWAKAERDRQREFWTTDAHRFYLDDARLATGGMISDKNLSLLNPWGGLVGPDEGLWIPWWLPLVGGIAIHGESHDAGGWVRSTFGLGHYGWLTGDNMFGGQIGGVLREILIHPIRLAWRAVTAATRYR